MDKRLAISAIVFFISTAPAALGLRAAKNRQIPLRDGFALSGINGRLIIHDSNEDNPEFSFDRWSFEFDSDVSDGGGIVKAGASLDILPSSVLERMIADANNNSNTDHRLWGRVTQYRGKNYIFPTYFLPLAKVKQPQSSKSQKSPPQENRPKINEPNDVLTIPKELIDKLPDRKKRIDHRTRENNGTESTDKKRSKLKQDYILADRCGFIRESRQETQKSWGEASFVPDAIGRTEAKTSFRLLPCAALEQAQRTQSAAPDVLHFKTAGIVTKFQGKDYLLLQRATRVYSHGNFGG